MIDQTILRISESNGGCRGFVRPLSPCKDRRGTQSVDPSARPHLPFQNDHIMTGTIEFVCG
jgi:hypothetical protein